MLRKSESRTKVVYGKARSGERDWGWRADPIYESNWEDFARCDWTFDYTTRQELRVSPTGMVERQAVRSPLYANRPITQIYSAQAIQAFALVSEMNHLSTPQLATLMGMDAGRVQTVMEELLLHGLVMRLVPGPGKEGIIKRQYMDVWRVARSTPNRRLNRWLGGLSPLDYALICNNIDPERLSGSNSPSAMRHNLVTNEIVIRAMEACPAIIGNWGERHCRSNAFFDYEKFPEEETRKNIGDCALVTRNGKIIVVETIGSSFKGSRDGKHNSVARKVAGWVAACGYSSLDLNVVMMDVSANPSPEHIRILSEVGINLISKEYVSREKYREKGGAKIHVVDGRRWFPFARGISPEFLDLRCYNVSQRRFVNLLDEDDYVTDPDNDVVRNTLAALHTPEWIKNMPELKVV